MTLCETSEGVPVVAAWVPSGETLYLAMREKHCLKSTTRRPEAFLDWNVTSFRPDERSCRLLK